MTRGPVWWSAWVVAALATAILAVLGLDWAFGPRRAAWQRILGGLAALMAAGLVAGPVGAGLAAVLGAISGGGEAHGRSSAAGAP